MGLRERRRFFFFYVKIGENPNLLGIRNNFNSRWEIRVKRKWGKVGFGFGREIEEWLGFLSGRGGRGN